MLLRLLIFIILGVLIYRAVKSRSGSGGRKSMDGRQPPAGIEDDMIQDPHCGVYFPRRDGVPFMEDGRQLLFCSEDCRDAFLARKKKDNSAEGESE